VLEVGRTRRERRSHAKTDALDALRAARSVLGAAKLASPRAGGEREALRALTVARAGALTAKKAGLCQLRALLVTCPEPLRSELRLLTRARLLRRLQAVRPERHRDAELRGTLIALRALARRVQALTGEERELKHEIQALVARLAPALLAEPGIGPASAAQLLLSWSHHGRFRNEAAFARLAGAAPIPASSGLVFRHRLDPGGDRQLNQGATHDCREPAQEPRTDDRLRRTAARRRQEHARDDPLPQPLPRAPPLPSAGGRSADGLTLIEASPKQLSLLAAPGCVKYWKRWCEP